MNHASSTKPAIIARRIAALLIAGILLTQFAAPAVFAVDTTTTAWVGTTTVWGTNNPALRTAGTTQGIYLKDGVLFNVAITGTGSARILNIGNLVTTTFTNNTGFCVNSAGTLTLGGTNASGIISISQAIKPINPANPIEHIP